jgi:hypothetical protein
MRLRMYIVTLGSINLRELMDPIYNQRCRPQVQQDDKIFGLSKSFVHLMTILSH